MDEKNGTVGANLNIKVSVSTQEKYLIAISIMVASLIGLFSSDYFMFYFGMAFAFSGFIPPLNVKGFGLVFLFSHSGSGMAIMMASFGKIIWKNPLLSDGFTIFNLFIIVSILMVVMSFVTMIIYNLNEKAREINCFLALPFIFCSLSVFTMGITSIILSYFI